MMNAYENGDVRMGWEDIVTDKSFALALQFVEVYDFCIRSEKNMSSASNCCVAAPLSEREAEYAESKADFVHKMSIALKEANESLYWMELLLKSKYLEDELHGSIYKDLVEVRKLLISIVKTSKT